MNRSYTLSYLPTPKKKVIPCLLMYSCSRVTAPQTVQISKSSSNSHHIDQAAFHVHLEIENWIQDVPRRHGMLQIQLWTETCQEQNHELHWTSDKLPPSAQDLQHLIDQSSVSPGSNAPAGPQHRRHDCDFPSESRLFLDPLNLKQHASPTPARKGGLLITNQQSHKASFLRARIGYSG